MKKTVLLGLIIFLIGCSDQESAESQSIINQQSNAEESIINKVEEHHSNYDHSDIDN
ncbi:hypothetical protein [Geomicrobium sp. JCM 19055]|uniref:hypothetical protein n=1 Tax=Geomicrobium sp. JCM 19055 TaxID=1460649 RepID=UPI00187CF7B3|nr:hypothetical protein [Geomicrobium sp. JCM 19055]